MLGGGGLRVCVCVCVCAIACLRRRASMRVLACVKQEPYSDSSFSSSEVRSLCPGASCPLSVCLSVQHLRRE